LLAVVQELVVHIQAAVAVQVDFFIHLLKVYWEVIP
jgi:hypothetical protein